jgi:hypothetical protein
MPAIQPARLKIQVTNLVEKSNSPQHFVKDLLTIYEFYADRTKRPGKSGPGFSLRQVYNIPRQVSKRIDVILKPALSKDPETGFALADAVWEIKWLECQVLALDILGWLPPKPLAAVTVRIKNWGPECGEDRQLAAALTRSCRRIRVEHPQVFYQILETWLKSSEIPARRIGLRLIPALVADPQFLNLPSIFNLISTVLQGEQRTSNEDLLAVTEALIQKSPQETAYFLRQTLTRTNRPEIEILIRNSLSAFPPRIRGALREFLRQRRETLES